MEIPFLILITLASLSHTPLARLSTTYYANKCPEFDSIMRETITSKQISTPTTAAATLRLLFHDCMVEGCDASVLIASNPFNQAERDADINLSLAGDGFDLVIRAKTALELTCPGMVSCSDILARATRDLITMVGGPFYPVRLGRKDGFVSKANRVEGNLPRGNSTLDDIINIFTSKGFTIREMVALSGAHTIGFAHCKEFTSRVFNFNGSMKPDPGLHPLYAEGLRRTCSNYTKDPSMSAFNDVMTPNKFDNMYYQNLLRGLGLLASDHALVVDPRTQKFVEQYAKDQKVFFDDFAHAMGKMSILGTKMGRKGEVRHRCDAFNQFKAHNT